MYRLKRTLNIQLKLNGVSYIAQAYARCYCHDAVKREAHTFPQRIMHDAGNSGNSEKIKEIETGQAMSGQT